MERLVIVLDEPTMSRVLAWDFTAVVLPYADAYFVAVGDRIAFMSSVRRRFARRTVRSSQWYLSEQIAQEYIDPRKRALVCEVLSAPNMDAEATGVVAITFK